MNLDQSDNEYKKLKLKKRKEGLTKSETIAYKALKKVKWK